MGGNVHELSNPYAEAHTGKAIWQVTSTVTLFFLGLFLMYHSPWYLALLIAIPVAGLHTRIFVLFHDCGHLSLFHKQRTNIIVGYFLGILTFTPFYQWKNTHDRHHGTSGNLDEHGIGDLHVLTVEQYMNKSKYKKILYRIYRHPAFLFTIAPALLILVSYRFRRRKGLGKNQLWEKLDVWGVNLALALIIGTAIYTMGISTFSLLFFPWFALNGAFGVWLFYMQHQHEEAYYKRSKHWKYIHAALKGSTYYKLPKILQWFTGSIGIHHVHHLNPKIPNYNLQKCVDNHPEVFNENYVTFFKSLKYVKCNLWDEKEEKMISFRDLAKYQ